MLEEAHPNYLDLITYISSNSGHNIFHDNLDFTSSLFDLIPASIYWKDNNGIYLGRNSYSAIKMIRQGFETTLCKEYVMGKSDYEIFGNEIAEKFNVNDSLLFSGTKKSIQCVENILLNSGEQISQISSKKLFINDKGKMFILGCTIDVTGLTLLKKSKQTVTKNLLNALQDFMITPRFPLLNLIIKSLRQIAIQYHQQHDLRMLLIFSDREMECLCLSVRGFSCKQIAKILEDVEHRTVEKFMEGIKTKLNVSNKSEIIDWFWKQIACLKLCEDNYVLT